MEFAISLDGGFAIVILLGVAGAAQIAAATMLYRRTDLIALKALAAAAFAAGVAIWAFILWITPVSAMRGG